MILSWPWIIFWIAFFLFFIFAAAISIFFLNRLRWNYTWVLLEEQPNGTSQITRRGRARLMSFGDGGEEIFYLKGLNKWRVAYGKRIGNRQIAWEIGTDGYWYNINFGGLDKRLKELGVYPVDRDMRYAYASARKGIDNRYDKKNFMEKYGTFIAFGMLFACILAMGAFAWLILHGQQKVAALNVQSMETQKQVMDASKAVLDSTRDVLSGLANVKTIGGSGAVTVPGAAA